MSHYLHQRSFWAFFILVLLILNGCGTRVSAITPQASGTPPTPSAPPLPPTAAGSPSVAAASPLTQPDTLAPGQVTRVIDGDRPHARDRYGQRLGYGWPPDGRQFNHTMIADGFAFEYTYRLDESYIS